MNCMIAGLHDCGIRRAGSGEQRERSEEQGAGSGEQGAGRAALSERSYRGAGEGEIALVHDCGIAGWGERGGLGGLFPAEEGDGEDGEGEGGSTRLRSKLFMAVSSQRPATLTQQAMAELIRTTLQALYRSPP